MIGRLRGTLLWKQTPWLLIEVGGVGYELEAPLSTFQCLPENGAEVTLLTHLLVREDAHALYGFASSAERNLFRCLIRVTGVGARVALLILSGMSVERFGRCVRDSDSAALMRLPGIGKKTAERLIMELRDRITELDRQAPRGPMSSGDVATTTQNAVEDAISALAALGYKLPEASRMVQSLDTQGMSSEVIIRQALQAAVRR